MEETKEQKIRRISNLLDTEMKKAANNIDNWHNYLNMASKFYKYSFTDQILISSQNPNAELCADYNLWNKKFGRYVQKSEKGIPLLYEENGRKKIRYVFDISSTRELENTREVKVWELISSQLAAVNKNLAEKNNININEISDKNFGKILYHEQNFADIIKIRIDGILKNSAGEYVENIINHKNGTNLEKFDNSEIEDIFNRIAKYSIRYVAAKRCGFEPELRDKYFENVTDFNSAKLISQLGKAVSEISGTVLREIEREVKTIEKELERSGNYERHILTGSNGREITADNGGHKDRQNSDRLQSDNKVTGGRGISEVYGRERSDIRTGRSDVSVSSDAGAGRGGRIRDGNVGTAQTGISEKRESRNVRSTDDKGSLGTLDTDRQSGLRNGGQVNRRNDESGERDGRTQNDQSIGMGRQSEQHQEQSEGDNLQRADLYLEQVGEKAEDIKSPAFSFARNSDLSKINTINDLLAQAKKLYDELPNDLKNNNIDTLFNQVKNTLNQNNSNIKNESQAQNKSNIIGNTTFKYISKKTYRKLDNDIALKVAEEFEKANIKYSGKYNNDNTITLTFSGNDKDKCEDIIKSVQNTNGFTPEQLETARKTNIVDYLQSRGQQLKRVGSEYTIPEHDSMRIKENKFFWNSQNIGGNALDFCMEYYNMDFESAVTELLAFNGHSVNLNNKAINMQSDVKKLSESEIKANNSVQNKHKPFPNELTNNKNRVTEYLHEIRGISDETINDFLIKDKIGQDTKGNAVFKIFDKDANISGAEISGTSEKRYKQTTEQNGNGFSFYSGDKIPKRAVFFESAIDLISFYDMNKETSKDFLLVSMAGLKDKVVLKTIEDYGISYSNCFIASDYDEAGRNFADKMQKEYGISPLNMFDDDFKKYNSKDWNDLLKAEKSAENNTIKMTVYHGTIADFDKFRTDYRGAVWTAAEFDDVRVFAGNLPESKIITAEAELKNPQNISFFYDENWDIDATVRNAVNQGYDGIIIDFKFMKTENNFYEFNLKKFPDNNAEDVLSSIGINGAAKENETISEFDRRMKENDYIIKTYVAVLDSDKIKIIDKTNIFEENLLETTEKTITKAEELKIGDVIKLPPVTMIMQSFGKEEKEKTFPSEYGVVINIENNMISFQTYSDKELQNIISRTGQTISMLNESGFEYIGIEKEIKQGAVQTKKADENSQQADRNLSLTNKKSEIIEALESGKIIRLKDTPVPMIADARANYFSNQKLSKEIDGNFTLKGKVSQGLGTPQDFELSFENAEKAEKYITSHTMEYYIEDSEQNIEDEREPRYEVTQTSDAYDAGEDFAVWDNEKNDYYFDKDGTIKTFETEKEAKEYLKNYVLSNKTDVTQNEETIENTEKMTAEQLKIGDVVKLPPVTMLMYILGEGEDEKTFPSKYGVVINIENNMISFQIYSDKELQNEINQTIQPISELNENGFEYIGTEEEIKQGAVQTKKAAENGQQADNNLSLKSEESKNPTLNIEKNTEKPDTLKAGDIIFYDNAKWEITDTDTIIDFKNLDENADMNEFSYVGSVENFIELNDFTLISRADEKIINENGQQSVSNMDLTSDNTESEPVSQNNKIFSEYENENNAEEKHIKANEITLGDKFIYNGEEVEVTSLRGIYPDEVAVSINQTSDNLRYITTQNVGRHDLEVFGQYLGNTNNSIKENISQTKIDKAKNFRITNDQLGVGTAGEKYQNNINAVKTLITIENENRQATPEEQEILSKYIGWGGLPDVFDERKPNWAEKYGELKELLTEEEYTSARSSVLNAHYTSPTVINAIYKGLENLGFKGGKVLEPSMGVGNFFGCMPENLSDKTRLYGVELDSVSGRIAKLLYPKSNIQIKGFEKTNFQSNFFDVAIGNVPFGDYRVNDNNFKSNALIHYFFFQKSLDKIKPGGVIAFITSKGTLDKKDSSIRKYLAERADLLGAVRLPNETFKANAGTNATFYDIIFLQKKDHISDFTKEITPAWVNVGVNEKGFEINNYFIENPEMICGEMITVSSAYGPKAACKGFSDKDFSETLNSAVSKIKGKIAESEIIIDDENETIKNNNIIAENYRNFCYAVIDGKIYFRENENMTEKNFDKVKTQKIKLMVNISEALRNLITAQKEFCGDDELNKLQSVLNMRYDNFTNKFGLLSDRKNKSLFREDDTSALLLSLENLNDKGEFIGKADIFTKRTIIPYVPVDHVDTSSEALIVSISERAKVDLDFMSQLCGKEKEEIIEDLKGVIFKNPRTNEYENADEYLSGNIREKLETAKFYAKDNPEYEINVTSLAKVIPPDLKPSEISIQLGSAWVPAKYYEQFIYELLDTPYYSRSNCSWRKSGNPFESGSGGNRNTITLSYDKHTATFGISNKTADRNKLNVTQTYDTKRMNAYKIIEETLNMKPVKVMDYVEDAEGRKKAVLNQKETLLAQEKQSIIKNKFEEWIFNDSERTEDLCRIYNNNFNSVRPREYDGSHITFGGINPEIKLRKHQIDTIAHTLYGGNTLLAHTMGTGKTFEMVASAMESKRLGLYTKSMIVVSKHIVNQVAKEFLQLYPTVNILVPNEKDFSKDNRERFCSRIATGNYDAIIISHTQLEKIPLSQERQIDYIQNKIDETIEFIESAKAVSGQEFTVKQLETTKKNLEDKLEKT